jgi:hypothetical protein
MLRKTIAPPAGFGVLEDQIQMVAKLSSTIFDSEKCLKTMLALLQENRQRIWNR